MSRVAIMIHTFLRDRQLFSCVEDIKSNFNVPYKIYIGDGGLLNEEKLRFYDKLKSEGHEVVYMPFDISPAKSRNILVNKITEEYIFKCDDDFRIKSSDLPKAIEFLNEQEDIGVLGFQVRSRIRISDYLFNAKREGKSIKMTQKVFDWKKYRNGIRFDFVDLIPDCFIARIDVLEKNKWDEDFSVGEGLHSHFFLTMKFINNIKVAYTDSIEIYHDKEMPNCALYKKLRLRYGADPSKILKKWKVNTITRL